MSLAIRLGGDGVPASISIYQIDVGASLGELKVDHRWPTTTVDQPVDQLFADGISMSENYIMRPVTRIIRIQ